MSIEKYQNMISDKSVCKKYIINEDTYEITQAVIDDFFDIFNEYICEVNDIDFNENSNNNENSNKFLI